MNGVLFYIVGPSGSGKDSLLDYARARVSRNVHFARRTITRPASSGGENHLAVTAPEFDRLLATGAFAMHWRANGHDYGIGREIGQWLKKGHTVVVSGSRAHLPKAMAAFPRLRVVFVSASQEILRARLARRGREDPGAIEARLARASALKLPPGVIAHEIVNDGEISHAGCRLLGLLV